MKYPVIEMPFSWTAVNAIFKPGVLVVFNGTRQTGLREVVELRKNCWYDWGKENPTRRRMPSCPKEVSVVGWKLIRDYRTKDYKRDLSTENGLDKLRAVKHNGTWVKIKWTYGNANLQA